ncbi:hypothetical protein RM844_06480 [Streptomyces sp. DSM 44915]|uniref:Uncharacterized protein n=1 Tax=Streptomyces chisholmiae TaxID=3075540 RepID=A0ABU2JLS8_9ACTN|nr:hypothetical protein [Streptomyces sp. DSM 44915]MDT0265936.1 hypothetical protein [Streptomyces sp. DSM 44915]
MTDEPQAAIRELLRLARRFDDALGHQRLSAASALLDAVVPPLDSADLRALVSLLPANGDTAYGLNWSLLHTIEAAEAWPVWELLDDEGNAWVRMLRGRLANVGELPPGAERT